MRQSLQEWFLNQGSKSQYLILLALGLIPAITPVLLTDLTPIQSISVRISIFVVILAINTSLLILFDQGRRDNTIQLKDSLKDLDREKKKVAGYLHNEVRVSGYINNVISEKSQRFTETLKDIHTSSTPPEEVFLKITQPDIQINSLLAALASVIFAEANADEITHSTLKIVLFGIDLENDCYKQLFSFPRDYNIEDDITCLPLNAGIVGLSNRMNDIVVIENIEKDLDKDNKAIHYYEQGKTPVEMLRGSAATMPIKDNSKGSEDLFLSIYIDKPDFFSEDADQIKIFKKTVINPFITRIKLEMRLLYLKEVTKEIIANQKKISK